MKKVYLARVSTPETITVDEIVPSLVNYPGSFIKVYEDINIEIYIDEPVDELFTMEYVYESINNSKELASYFDVEVEGASGVINDLSKAKKNFLSHNKEPEKDMVHSPSHYMLEDGTEVKMHILALLGKEGFINYAKGNIIKYTARLGKKDNMDQELGKIQEYAQMIRDVIAD